MPRNYLEACCLGEYPELRGPLEAAATGLWPALVRTLVENGASPWAKKYWLYNIEQDSTHNPYFTFIITDLLTADKETSDLKRRLQGARLLLTKTTDMRDRLCPKTVEDLHALLVTFNHMLQADYNDAHEEITALWSEIHEVFRVLPNLPCDQKFERRYHHGLSYSDEKSSVRRDYQNRGIVYVAAKQRNTSALDCLLRLGFSVDGSIWNRLTLTPYDTVRGRASCRDDSDEAQCMATLQERGAHPGLFYSVEVQILLTVLTLYLLVRLVLYDIPWFVWVMQGIPQFPELLADAWRGIREDASVWVSVLLVLLIAIMGIMLLLFGTVLASLPILIMGGYTFFVILSFGRTVPKWFMKPDKCPWWVTTKSNTAVLLHILPWVWPLTYEMHGGDFELVGHFVYGPTVTIIRSLRRRYTPHTQQGPIALSEETTEEAESVAGDVEIHVGSDSQHSRSSRRTRDQTFTRLINASLHLIASLPRTIAALTQGLARKKFMQGQGKPRSSYQESYRDDDNKELSLLLRSEEYDDDIYDLE